MQEPVDISLSFTPEGNIFHSFVYFIALLISMFSGFLVLLMRSVSDRPLD